MATINRIEELTQPKELDAAEKGDLILLTRKLRKYVDTKNSELANSVKELIEQIKLLRQEQKSLKDYWDLQSASLRKDLFDKSLAQSVTQDAWLTKRLEASGNTEVESHSKSFTAGAESVLKQFESFFKMLPMQQLVIPDGAIKVLQDAPNINVTLAAPDKAFKVDVAPTVVTIPKDAFKVNVHVPEQLPPDVKVEVNNKPMVKTFSYHENGQPKEVVERYLDEDE